MLPSFNSWKLIAARWILRQHNINAITTYFKYLMRQFNLTSEWDLIIQLPHSRSQALTFLITKLLFRGNLSLNNLTESWRKLHKQPSREVFLEKDVLKICIKFKGEHLCQSAISINLQSNFIETKLWHWCSPVNLLYIFKTTFNKNTYGGLLLQVAL